MDAREAALARSRGYALIGELFRRGLQADTLDAWRHVGWPGLPDVFDADDAGAAHERVTAEVFPYEAVFVGEEGLRGGDAADAVARTRAEVGLGEVGEPDQLGEELLLLAFLCAAEADARRDGVKAGHVLAAQRRVLDRHLLRWLPAFVAALGGAGFPGKGVLGLYPRAAAMALDLAVAHRAAIGPDGDAWALPEARSADELLHDEKTGLARIARHLTLTARAGGFLTAGAMARIGRGLDLPRGFGKRWQVLESLLAAAAHYDAVPAVLAGLDAELVRWDEGYREVEAAGLAAAVAPWRARVAEAREVVRGMAAGVGAG